MTTQRILDSAERRLLGSIKHGDSAQKLAVNAERVRHAQLGRVKSKNRSATLPTDSTNEEMERVRASLEAAKVSWESMSVDEIIALYAKQLKL